MNVNLIRQYKTCKFSGLANDANILPSTWNTGQQTPDKFVFIFHRLTLVYLLLGPPRRGLTPTIRTVCIGIQLAFLLTFYATGSNVRLTALILINFDSGDFYFILFFKADGFLRHENNI